MCALHDKWNAFFRIRHSARMFSSGLHYLTSACLGHATFHHIYIRQIDTPTWCLFYFTGPALFSSITLVRSLDLSPTPASPLANLPSGSIIASIRLLDLAIIPLSSSSGPSTSWCFYRCQRQVARPRCGSVVVLVRSLDLPPAPSSLSLGR
jgi:hypothetical protein